MPLCTYSSTISLLHKLQIASLEVLIIVTMIQPLAIWLLLNVTSNKECKIVCKNLLDLLLAYYGVSLLDKLMR